MGETVTGLKGNMENLSVNTQEIETKLILDYLDNIWKIENIKKRKIENKKNQRLFQMLTFYIIWKLIFYIVWKPKIFLCFQQV